MNISVIGTGYVGLVTGACLAGSGNNVICVDIDEEKINSLKEGRVTFYEPGLENIVKKNLKEERLLFTTDLDYAIKNSSVVLIAVGTPPNGDGSAEFKKAVLKFWQPAVQEFQPEMIFVSAGFDAHRLDSLAGLNFETEDYFWVGQLIQVWAQEICKGRLVSTLEGGYNLAVLKDCVSAYLCGMLSIIKKET